MGIQTKFDEWTIELSKLKDIQETLNRLRMSIDRLHQEAEYNQSHYMMIENYMEKYMPIVLQDAIQTNLKSFISTKDQTQLDYYIKSRRKELHGIILDNEEIPDLVNKMNSIRTELGRIPFPLRNQKGKDASNSDVQSSSFMHSNSMMSRQFFAFQGGKGGAGSQLHTLKISNSKSKQ